jgi:hypothetical protein
MNLDKLILPIFIGILAFVLIKFFLASRDKVTEAFGFSDGTLIQLSSSHVPTQEDEEELIAQKRQIQSDLIDMTGSP